MAITYVGGQIAGFAGKTATTSAAFALSGGLATVPSALDLVIVAYHVGGTSDVALTISATDGTAYTLAGTELYQNDNYDSNLRVGYRFMPATPDATIRLSGTGAVENAGHYTIHVFRNVNQITPLDTAVVTAGAANTRLAHPGNITPVTAGAWVYMAGGAATAAGGTYTASALTAFLAGSTADTVDSQIGAGYYPDWTSGEYDPAAFKAGGTDTANDSWNAVTIALQPVVDYTLNATGVATTPVVGAPALTQNHALTATGVTTAPVVGNPAATQNHVLNATGITAAPAIGAPALTQNYSILPYDRANGLEGLWLFEGDSLADQSGKGHNVTTLQNIGFVDDGVGRVLSFPDRTVARYASTGSIDARGWTSFSIVWRCNKTDIATAEEYVINFGSDNSNGFSIYVGVGTNTMVIYFNRGGANESVTIGASAFDATVRQYALTFDLASKAWVVYKDVASFNSGTLTNTPLMPNWPLRLGCNQWSAASSTWIGLIGGVWLYKNKILTTTDLEAIAANPYQPDTILSTTPTIGSPSLTPNHVFNATEITATPTVGAPAVSQNHALTASGTTATPSVGTPALTQNTTFAPTGIICTPVVDNPEIWQQIPPIERPRGVPVMVRKHRSASFELAPFLEEEHFRTWPAGRR